MTRTIKLDRPMLESLVTLIGEGQWPSTASRSLGIHNSTFTRWLAAGEEEAMTGVRSETDPEGLCLELFLRCDEAEARCEVGMVQILLDRIEKTQYFQGAMTFLARRFPERWGERREISSGEETWEQQVAKLEGELALNDHAPDRAT